MLLKTPISAEVLDVDSVRFRPHGRQSRIVAEVDLDLRPLGIHRDLRLERNALLDARQRHGVVDVVSGARAGRQRPDRCAHALLAVVEPVGDVPVESVPTDLIAHSEQLAFADTGGPDHPEVVAVPVLGHADSGRAHANHIVDVAVVLLDLHGREDQRPFLVDVAGRRRQRRRFELPMSAMCAFTTAVARWRPSSSTTGTMMQWSPAWEFP